MKISNDTLQIYRKNGVILIDKDIYNLVKSEGYCLTVWNAKMDNGFYPAVYLFKREYKQRTTVKRIKLSRFILKISDSNIFAEHINRNPLDNRIENLRLANRSQNRSNAKKAMGTTSKFKGVSYVKADKIWISSIKKNGKLIRLGRFKNEIDAALAYDDAAKKYFGEFAATNKDLGLFG